MSQLKFVVNESVPKDMLFIAQDGEIKGGGREDPIEGWLIYDPALARGMAELLGVSLLPPEKEGA